LLCTVSAVERAAAAAKAAAGTTRKRRAPGQQEDDGEAPPARKKKPAASTITTAEQAAAAERGAATDAAAAAAAAHKAALLAALQQRADAMQPRLLALEAQLLDGKLHQSAWAAAGPLFADVCTLRGDALEAAAAVEGAAALASRAGVIMQNLLRAASAADWATDHVDIYGRVCALRLPPFQSRMMPPRAHLLLLPEPAHCVGGASPLLRLAGGHRGAERSAAAAGQHGGRGAGRCSERCGGGVSAAAQQPHFCASKQSG